MHITVILCTYNRCRVLPKALTSIAASQLPDPVEWEVLVVDNNSKDATSDVVRDFAVKHPGRIRYLFEPRAGKSNALNAGIREAAGDILAFMDDDVVVEPTWLDRVTRPLREEQWTGCGGRILPDWTREPPRWLSLEGRYVLAPLAVFDLGPEPGELHEAPFGTSMAFRREAFERHGGFRTDLGPHPGSEIRSEDTEFGRRVLEAGERLWYEPSAVVYHPVPDARLQKNYFLAWWFDKGRADIREFGLKPDAKGAVAGIPIYLFRNLLMQVLRWATAFDARARFRCKSAVWQKAGQIVECRNRTASPLTHSLERT